jgi:hypothetical protein
MLTLQANGAHMSGLQMLQEGRIPRASPCLSKTHHITPSKTTLDTQTTPSARRERNATPATVNEQRQRQSYSERFRLHSTGGPHNGRRPNQSQALQSSASQGTQGEKGRASGLINPAPMMTSTPLPANRFELLPDEADDVVAQIPVPLEEGELNLPPLSQPKTTALTQQDFQLRERAMFVDIESLPSEAMIQLAITHKYTDHTLAANAMRAADKAWGATEISSAS